MAIVLKHGTHISIETGAPILDLSICWTGEKLLASPFLLGFGNAHTMYISEEEGKIWKEYIQFSAQNSCFPNPHESLVSNNLQNYFVRIALCPIYTTEPQKFEAKKDLAPACSFCKSPRCTKKCSACSKAFYCSGKCQQAHWKVHKKECNKKKGF